MDKKEVIQVLEALAGGVDPVSGEIFPADSPYQSVEVTRALFHALEAVKGAKDKKPLPERQGEKWTEQEDQQLTEGFNNEVKVAELAKTHQRTSGAIRSRLKKLGLIEE